MGPVEFVIPEFDYISDQYYDIKMKKKYISDILVGYTEKNQGVMPLNS
jgi:hypothetical protein